MNKKFWKLLFIIWIIGCCIAAIYLRDIFGNSTIVKIVFGLIAFLGIAILYSKVDESEHEESDLYNRIRTLENNQKYLEDKLDRLDNDIQKLNNKIY